MKTVSESSASTQAPEDDELGLLLEAARRATWDATHGPNHLRSGRFFISANLNAHAWETPPVRADETSQQDVDSKRTVA